jgi:Ca-activated chloride channel family protein
MSFASPVFLLGLLAVPLLLAGYVLLQRRRTRYALRFTNLDLLANVVERSPAWRRHVPPALFLLALALLLTGVARPHTMVEVPREEGGVVLVLDVSGSMRATDVEPTRLDGARSAAESFLDRIPEAFRVGLVTFSGEANVAVSLTDDRDLVRATLDRLVADGGTAIGDAVVRAVDLSRPVLRQQSDRRPGERPVAVVLLSDGKPSPGTRDPAEAAATAKRAGVPVHTVALGTDAGTVEVIRPDGIRETVAVPPDRPTLRAIAETTGGRFFAAPSDDAVREVYEELGSQIGYTDEERDVTYLFAAAGATLLVASGILSALWFSRLP